MKSPVSQMIVSYSEKSKTMLVVRTVKKISVSKQEKKKWIRVDNCNTEKIIQIMFGFDAEIRNSRYDSGE